jgi:hypothetical protein
MADDTPAHEMTTLRKQIAVVNICIVPATAGAERLHCTAIGPKVDWPAACSGEAGFAVVNVGG